VRTLTLNEAENSLSSTAEKHRGTRKQFAGLRLAVYNQRPLHTCGCASPGDINAVTNDFMLQRAFTVLLIVRSTQSIIGRKKNRWRIRAVVDYTEQRKYEHCMQQISHVHRPTDTALFTLID